MRAINNKAREIFQAVIDRIPAGQSSVVLDEGDQAHGGAIMALHCEKIGANRYGEIYSFAHYYEQNGDMMRDPDITMLRAQDYRFYPLSYRQDGLGIDRQYVMFQGNGYRINKRMQADLAVFCGQWAENIKHQQNISRIENGKIIFQERLIA